MGRIIAEGTDAGSLRELVEAGRQVVLAEPAPPDRFRDGMLERTAVRLEASS